LNFKLLYWISKFNTFLDMFSSLNMRKVWESECWLVSKYTERIFFFTLMNKFSYLGGFEKTCRREKNDFFTLMKKLSYLGDFEKTCRREKNWRCRKNPWIICFMVDIVYKRISHTLGRYGTVQVGLSWSWLGTPSSCIHNHLDV